MNLKVANDRLIVLESQINNILNKKECEESKVLTQATVYKKDVVFTSRVEKNKFLYYIFNNQKYDEKLSILYKEKEILLKYINMELKRLNKYKEKEKLIIYYKEDLTQKLKWTEISNKVNLSVSQCRLIYRVYKQKRNI